MKTLKRVRPISKTSSFRSLALAGLFVPWALAAPAALAESSILGTITSAVQSALPGTEEYGMSKKDLVNNIESVEASIAACMRQNGFEYVAVDYKTVRQGMTSDKSLPGMSEKEFVKQYGFGIATLYTGEGPQLSKLRTPAQIGLGERNIAIFNQLSKTDQVAYNHALFGEHSDATFAVALETEDFSRTGGCTRKAVEKTFKPEQLKSSYRNPKDAKIEQDPRMVAALGKWAERMRAAGFEYSHPRDVELDIKKRLDEITGGAPVASLSADAQAALKKLQQYERAAGALTVELEEEVLDPVDSQIEREFW